MLSEDGSRNIDIYVLNETNDNVMLEFTVIYTFAQIVKLYYSNVPVQIDGSFSNDHF